jgi:hypothetical protein
MTAGHSRSELAEALGAQLFNRAPHYFPELAARSTTVLLLRYERRRASTLLRFAIDDGTEQRTVVVKIPRSASQRARPSPEPAGESDRPRLATVMASSAKVSLEYDALSAIRRHFDRIGDRRLGAVRVLDLLPEHRALVMESVPGTSLRTLLLKSLLYPRAGRSSTLETAFRHAGAWLRTYHALPRGANAEARDTCRTDYIRFIHHVAAFLHRHTSETQVGAWARLAGAIARDALPEHLPLGLGHGDFALRNLLVEPDGRATGIDTLGRYRTPIYEDIGCFLASLWCSWPQVVSPGAGFRRALLTACERSFLAGYFHDGPIPVAAVRLYEVQALLDLWASALWHQRGVAGGTGAFQRMIKVRLLGRRIRQRVENSLRRAEDEGLHAARAPHDAPIG